MWVVNSLDLLISPTFSHSPNPCPGMFQKQLPSSKPEEEYLNLFSTSLGGLKNFLTSRPFIQEADGGIFHSRTLGNSRRRQGGPSGFWREEQVHRRVPAFIEGPGEGVGNSKDTGKKRVKDV